MVVSVAYQQKSCIRHCYHGVSVMKKLKYQSVNIQNRRSGEISNHIFETYKHSVMSHGNYMFKTASDMAMATMCAYP